jgi:hypothetical protein
MKRLILGGAVFLERYLVEVVLAGGQSSSR